MKNILTGVFIVTILFINNFCLCQESTVIIRIEESSYRFFSSKTQFVMYITDKDEIIVRRYNGIKEPQANLMIELKNEINNWLEKGYCLISFNTITVEGSRLDAITTVVLTKSKCSCNNQ